LLKKGYNIYKAGKLIKIFLEYEEKGHQDNIRTINSIKITGDFFLYPEDSLHILEMQLKGTKLEKAELKKKIDEFLGKSEAFGFDSESMSQAILGCIEDRA
jgi:lipoate---protein ligase